MTCWTPFSTTGPGSPTSSRPFTRSTSSPLAWSSMDSQIPNPVQSAAPLERKRGRVHPRRMPDLVSGLWQRAFSGKAVQGSGEEVCEPYRTHDRLPDAGRGVHGAQAGVQQPARILFGYVRLGYYHFVGGGYLLYGLRVVAEVQFAVYPRLP